MIFTNIRLKLSLLIVGFFALSSLLMGQNLSFSQYNYSPLQVNPGQVASQNDAMIMFNNRNQKYGSDFNINSSLLSIVYPLINKDGSKRWGGIGVSAINDQSSNENLFKFQGISGAFAYNFSVSEKSYLSVAVQGGYYQRELSTEGLTTGSQWVLGSGYDPATSIGENFENLTASYFNVSSGLFWYNVDTHERKKSYLGVSLFNLNQPNESFLNNGNKLPVRYVVTAGHRIFDNNKYSITPELLYIRQANVDVYNIGANFSYYFENDSPFDVINSGSLDFRAKYVEDNAVVLSIQLNQPNFSIGFSYDVEMSSSSSPDYSRKATEFAFAFKKTINRKKDQGPKIVEGYSLGEAREFYHKSDDKTKEENAGRADEVKDDENVDNENSGDNFQFELKKDFKFTFNDASLNEEAKLYLNDVIALLKSNSNLYLKVIGHTDNVGTSGANRKISLLRADAVVEYLIQEGGIDEKRLKAVGKADKEPLVPNDSEANKAKNRRVEFVLYK
jgi:type IX secretion system PorP/SprF family membrane protein